MEFRVLGPLEASRGGTVITVGSAQKQRLVLAALLSRADQAVTPDWLIGVVWADRPPASARQNLQHYIHQLRSILGSDRISSRPGGYVIHTEDGLDATRFRRLAAAGSEALKDGDAAQAGDRLRSALDLWRGHAYAEFTDCPVIANEAARLDELRLTAYEHWAEAELRLGHCGAPIQELTDLVRIHPYRESLRGYLMRSLYGAGRQADALQLFRNTRATFADELGVEPGPQLQRLHEQMLRGDSLLLAPHSVDTADDVRESIQGGAREQPVPRELPADISGFTGRGEVLKILDQMLPDDGDNPTEPVVISAITGMAGVGKTALALHWGHRVAHQFPDGQLYLNLHGHALGRRPLRPIEALNALLAALGVSPRQVPVEVTAAAARYRSHLAGRRILIVLDDAESSAQVRPLLAGSPGCMVLATSRDRLTGLVAQDGARRLTLDILSEGESMDLIGHLLGRQRMLTEPAAAVALARTCAHLPLALRIAGASLVDQPYRTIASYVAELTAGDPVAALAVDGDDNLAVRGAFELSYRALPEPAQQMFRRLGLVACLDFTAGAAAALAGTTEDRALQALERLAAAHLVVQHAAGRYTLHDLLRQYATNLVAVLDNPADRTTAARRLLDWFVSMSVVASALINPHILRLPAPPSSGIDLPGFTGAGSASEWLDAERHNLVTVIRYAARRGPLDLAWRCADALRAYNDQGGHLTDWLTTARCAVAAARADGSPLAQASAYWGLAHARYLHGHLGLSIMYVRRALALATEAKWYLGEATIANNLAIALHLDGHTTEAIGYIHRSLNSYEGHDWPIGRARTTASLANLYWEIGRLDEGLQLAVSARALYPPGVATTGEAQATALIGELCHLLGRLDEAEHFLTSPIPLFRALGARRSEAHCHARLARVHLDAGRLEEARVTAQTALEICDDVDVPVVHVVARHAFGLIREAQHDYAGAVDHHGAALTIAQKIGSRYNVGECLLGLASAHYGRGDHRAAGDHAAQALTLAHEAGFAVIEGRALTILGQVHHALGDATLALDHARRALANHQRTGHRIGEADTHVLLATILHHLADRTGAEHHRETARSLYQRMGANRGVLTDHDPPSGR